MNIGLFSIILLHTYIFFSSVHPLHVEDRKILVRATDISFKLISVLLLNGKGSYASGIKIGN